MDRNSEDAGPGRTAAGTHRIFAPLFRFADNVAEPRQRCPSGPENRTAVNRNLRRCIEMTAGPAFGSHQGRTEVRAQLADTHLRTGHFFDGEHHMEKLSDILDSILRVAAFDLGRSEAEGFGRSTSYARRPDEVIPAHELRHALDRENWNVQFVNRARDARLNCPKSLLTELDHCVRPLLEDYVDPETDRVGHAFPISGSGGSESIHAQYDGLLSVAWTSPVETFVKALVAGAAVIGVERTAALVAGWAKECPVNFRTFALINGGSLSRALNPVEGVAIGALPRSVDSLPISLRSSVSITPHQYAGRMVVSIATTVAPPLFRPDRDHLKRNVHASAAMSVDVTAVCQALSLVSNDYFDAGFCWHDYLELSLFSLSSADTYWSVGSAGLRNRPYASVSLNRSPNTGAVTLVLEDQPMHDLEDEEVGEMLNALAGCRREKSHSQVVAAISIWMKSKDPYESLADRFIDLRIALELLYCQGSRSELRSRVARSRACHLGSNQQERETIHKTLRDAYDSASQARVDSGRGQDRTLRRKAPVECAIDGWS